MKGFKTKQQMMEGHYCWGGKVMKKAEGGTVRSRFNSAFAEARKKGDKTFDFEGKKYTTEMAKPKPKIEVGPHGPGIEDNDYKSEPVAGARPSAEENARPTPPKQKMGYTLPDVGLRVGKKGESAITTAPSEAKEDKAKEKMDEAKSRLRSTDEEMLESDRSRMMKAKGGMAKGGYANGGMRSESTQAAKAHRNSFDAARDEYDAKINALTAQGYKARGITKADWNDAINRNKQATDKEINISKQTAHPYAGYSKKWGDEDLAEFRRDYDSDYGLQKKRGGMAKGGNWIAGAIKHKGALHRALGVPEGKKIPASKIEKATHSSNPKLAKRARLAQTLKSFHKG